ncbi:MAG: alpha/beta fold hydrolase [Alphaproteobacteria bacterium]|nr:alpha/beta fold hydrolase [Alphaproteobacteria bacterium]
MLVRLLRALSLGLGVVVLLVVLGVAGVIALSSPVAPPRLAAGDTLPGLASWNTAEIPPVSRISARDGAPLTYRLYPGRKDRAVILVHGSSGASYSMHKVAQALQSAGATVYSISLRGHGGSGTRNGDTSYQAQLDDDLFDFVKAAGLSASGIHRTLIGFSSGGGFVLRTASGPNAALFDDYVAVSPYIAYDSPTSRKEGGGWVGLALPRFLALSILDGLGLPWFQGLPVVHFATAAEADENRTPVYSYRLLTGMHLDRNWRAEIARIDRPTAVVLGAEDELFNAPQFKPLFASLNPRISVTVAPGLGHLAMIGDPRGSAAIAEAWQKLVAEDKVERFDFKVREDMFAGFDGDADAFKRAMTLIDTALAANPDHAQALVWRGAGRLFLAGQAFQRKDERQGQELQRQSLADMDRAVALAPNVIAVRIPRATALLPYARFERPFNRAEADQLTATAISDFEFTLQASAWDRLSEHGRGELLGGLADAWLGLGDSAKAAPYLERMAKQLAGTPYAKAAAARLADPASKAPLTCLGCH